MTNTKPFTETVIARAKRDPVFRAGLLTEALECIADNDFAAAKKMIRDYVKATMGFEALGKSVDKRPESLMRMLSAKGNPNVNNLGALLASLKRHEGIDFHVKATR